MVTIDLATPPGKTILTPLASWLVEFVDEMGFAASAASTTGT